MKIEEKVETLNKYYENLNIISISRKYTYWEIYSNSIFGKPELPKIRAYSFEELINKAYKILKEEIDE